MIKEKLLKYLNENPYIYLDEFIQLVHGDKAVSYTHLRAHETQ